VQEATRLILLRHGETPWNADTRIQGHTDIPLNDTGLWQAQRLGTALADQPLDAIYSSDLQRAWATARAVAAAHGLQVIPEPGLRERGFGALEGLTWADIETEHPEHATHWRTRVPDWAPPGGGESLLTLQARVLGVLNRVAAAHLGQHIALVAHGGVLDVLYRTAVGIDLQAPRSWLLKNAAINRVLWTPDSLTLVGWGDTSHLDTPHAPLLDEATTA
jgi:probable phosphoglycerate mutase